MKNSIKFFLVFFFAGFMHAQENNQFTFQVIDQETKTPISYATVLLKTQNKGTHADFDGIFQLPVFLNTIKVFIVSGIGFETKEFNIANYSINKLNKIYLKSSTYVLDDIVLKLEKRTKKKLEAKEIIQNAIANIKENYPLQPYSYIAHYRDYLQPKNEIYKISKNLDSNPKYVNLNEGIVEVFDSGFESKPVADINNQIALYDFQINDSYKIDTTLILPYDNFNAKLSKGLRIESFGGNELNILKIANPIRNYNSQSISFINSFNKDFLKNHYFKLEGRQKTQNDTLYEISFRTKKAKTTKIHRAAGKIYISKNNFAIFKLNYSLYKDAVKIPSYTLNLEYKPYKNKMYLDYISFNNLLEIKNTAQTELNYIGFLPSNNTLIFKFNNPMDYGSIKSWKRKITLFFDNKRLKIAKIEIKKMNISNKKLPLLFISIDSKKLKSFLKEDKSKEDFISRITVEFKRIKDRNDFLVSDAPPFKFYQFREMFVQKIFTNKQLPENKNFIDKNKPLLYANKAVFDFKNDFWINTPLKFED